MPEILTDEEIARADAQPEQLNDADIARADAQPAELTDADVARADNPKQELSDEQVAAADREQAQGSVIGRTIKEVAGQGAEMARQAAAGVVYDLPQMGARTLQAVLPGTGESSANPEGTGAAGAVSQVAAQSESDQAAAKWDDPTRQGWAAVPGMAARSLAPNLLLALATGGRGEAVMPMLYGGGRAQDIYNRIREKAFQDNLPFGEQEQEKARWNAAGAGALEGGLEYVSSLFGMTRQVRDLVKGIAVPSSRAATPAVAKGLAAGLRKLAGSMTVRHAATEAGTEFVQEGGGELHEQLIGISQAIEQQPDSIWNVNWKAVWDGAKLGAAAGALGSGMAGAVAHAARRTQETRDAKERTERRENQPDQTDPTDPTQDSYPTEGLAEQAENADTIPEDGTQGAQPAAGTEDSGGGASAETTVSATPAPEAITPPTAEQEQRATDEAAANAKKDYAKRKTIGANVSDELLESSPVKAMVLQFGGIRMDGTEDQRGIPPQFRSGKDTAQTLDQMLTEIQHSPEGTKYADWTTDDLIDALKGNEADKRRRFSERQADPQERAWLKSAWTVAPENLAIGFGFSVKGIPYRVADSDETGYVIERADGKNAGWSIRLDHGKLMNIDGGTLTNASGRKISKIRNYADPGQVRMWEAAGADEAAQQAEGFTIGEDDEMPFRKSGLTGQDTPDYAGKVNAEQATRDISADEIAKRDAEIIKQGFTVGPLFHGTWSPSLFDRFDATDGIYLTDDINVARSYTKAREAQIDGRRDKKKLSFNEWKKISRPRVLRSFIKPVRILDLSSFGDRLPLSYDMSKRVDADNPFSDDRLLKILNVSAEEFKNASGISADEFLREIGFYHNAEVSSPTLFLSAGKDTERVDPFVKDVLLKLGYKGVVFQDFSVGDAYSKRDFAKTYALFDSNDVELSGHIANSTPSFNQQPGSDAGTDNIRYRTTTAKPINQIRVVRRGADEAAQAGEGFAAGEDEDQPFRADDRGQMTEGGQTGNMTGVNKAPASGPSDSSAQSNADRDADKLVIPSADLTINEVLNRPASAQTVAVGGHFGNKSNRAYEAEARGLVSFDDIVRLTGYPRKLLLKVVPAQERHHNQDMQLVSYYSYPLTSIETFALQHMSPEAEDVSGLIHNITSLRSLQRRVEEYAARENKAFDPEKDPSFAAISKQIRDLDAKFFSELDDGNPDQKAKNKRTNDFYQSGKRKELRTQADKLRSELADASTKQADSKAQAMLVDYVQETINKISNILQPFNRQPGAYSGQDADIRYRTTGAKPVAQIRVVRRGYDENREAADDPAFTQWAQNPLDLPELVELATDLLDGKVPRVLKSMPANSNAVGYAKFKREQNAAGQAVFGRPEMIALLAANYKLVSDDEAETMQAAADAKARELTGEDGSQKTEDGEQKVAELAKRLFDEAYYAEVKSRVAAGPRFAMAVIAHEICHVADQSAKYGLVKPDRSQGKNRLNLIGRVAGMLSWTRDILTDDPAGKTLNADEISTLQGRARKNARPDTRGKELMRAITEKWAAMPELNELAANPELVNMVNARAFRDALEYMAREKPVLSEWFSITTFPEQVRATMEALKSLTAQSKTARHLGSAWFRAEFVKGLESQRQAHLGKMYSELESLIAWWNNGDRSMMDTYYEKPGEMFAEAFGVYLNNPLAVKKRAPMFWRTLLDYMGTRPEVQEWLDAFNQDMSRGPDTIQERRWQRVRDMFSKSRREQNRAVEQAGQAGMTRRLASDFARYMLSRKSGPLHALISTADALGYGEIAGRVEKWSDKVENVQGLEKMFAGQIHQIGAILEEGGLNIHDLDPWTFANMVAKSPAYIQKAAPLGMHPQAAKEQLDYVRQKIGDARANQLDKAIDRFQQIWQTDVVPRLEGMYDEPTMKMLRSNPIYFTLMVGMDDAEIKTFQTAMQTLNADEMLAFAQRTVNKSVFAQPVPSGIIRRVGTHRPAMSLLGATMLKGHRMIKDAAHNNLIISTRELLNTLKDPYFQDVADGETATDTRSQTVVRYFENGVKKAYYAPKYVGHFLRGDNPAEAMNAGMEVLRKYTAVNVWKRLQTMWSPRFMVTQPIADAKAWKTQMKGVRTPIGNIARGHVLGGLAQMLPASTWYLPASVFPPNSRERLMRPAREVIRRFYKTGEVDPRLRDLVERGMTDLNGAFQGVSRIDPDAGEILQLFAGIKPSKALEVYTQDLNAFQRGWKKLEAIPAFGKLFQAAGRTAEGLQSEMQVETLANKLAGMEYLDAKYPQMSEREKRRWVLHAAGNPNFAARSGADPFLDTLAWTFFNPAKEGYRSLYMAAKADPAGFMARAMWFNVAPNLIKWGATTGILAAVAESIIPHGATPEDEEDRKRYMDALKNWLGWFKRLPSYYGRRYVTIPIQPVGADSVFTITIPQAQSLAPINGLVNAMLDELAQLTGMKSGDNKGAERAITAVTDEISGLNFLSGNNRSAFVQVFGPLIEMLTTDKTNVYDPFYGRNVLDINEETLMAGGRFTLNALPAWEKLGKNAWNNAFGSAIGRFDTQTPRSDMPLKTDLQKLLSAPGISTLVGGLLRVTGGGEFERLEDMFSAEGQERAYDNVMVRKAALESLQDPQRRFPAWAAEKYIDDPVFQRNYNEYIISHDIYSGMSVEDRMLYSRTNPIWKRMMLLRERQKRQE